MAQTQPKENAYVFTISRTFDAPRERVWKAWTEADQLKQWFGPKGCAMNYCTIDPKPGGASRYGMVFGGNTMWGKWAYKEVKAPEKLVSIVTFTDETGEKTLPHPGNPGWPLEVHSTINFIARGDKTEILVEWEPYNPTETERTVFENGASSMQQGWGGTFDQLEEFLKTSK